MLYLCIQHPTTTTTKAAIIWVTMSLFQVKID